jgi:hypothetical protein
LCAGGDDRKSRTDDAIAPGDVQADYSLAIYGGFVDFRMTEQHSAPCRGEGQYSVECPSLNSPVRPGNIEVISPRAVNCRDRRLVTPASYFVQQIGAAEGINGIKEKTIPADFFSGKAIAVDEKHFEPGGSEVDGGNGSCRAGANHDNIEHSIGQSIEGTLQRFGGGLCIRFFVHKPWISSTKKTSGTTAESQSQTGA